MDDAEEVAHDFGGRSNPVEAERVAEIVERLIPDNSEIAVISPYSKQVQLIRAELHNRRIKGVKVGTVDSFQGQETDIVVFSAVRSNSLNEIGFLRDPRRLCVALTRARRGLILLGDPRVLQTSRHWEALLDSCRKRGCLVNSPANTEKELQDSVVETRRTLVSLDELQGALDGTSNVLGLFG